jgi:hypothetical protein
MAEATKRGRKARLMVVLSAPISKALRTEAKRRGVDRDDLIGRLLATIVTDDLFSAVLDR